MNVQCKAMTGLPAAGIVVGAPAEVSAANQVALPEPVTYSTAGLFTPVAQSAPLTIPVPPLRWPRPPCPAAAASAAPGRGAAQPNPARGDSLLVAVSGSQFPNGWLAPAAAGVTDLHVNVAQDPAIARHHGMDWTG